jgi:hypothetical protein
MNIQRLIQLFLLFSISFSGNIASAATETKEQLTIKLEELEKIKSQEKGGDELYFSITEYPARSPARHYQVPSFPSHWVSDYFKSLKNIVLWQKDMTTCEPTEIIFSLVEEDLPPWDPDDLLGSAKLKISCDAGKVVKEWIVPNKVNTNEEELKDKTVFEFKGEGADYRATFKVEENAVANVNKENKSVEKVKNNDKN